jgi:glyoxylase-like metal-dependent hydrolase (beta-lactamase superfamily II)
VLVDSSFRSVEDAMSYQVQAARRSAHQTLEYELARRGLAPIDIGYLIHTHVHMDHAGQDYLLPNAKILVQRKELQNSGRSEYLSCTLLRSPERRTPRQRFVESCRGPRRRSGTVGRYPLRTDAGPYARPSGGIRGNANREPQLSAAALR